MFDEVLIESAGTDRQKGGWITAAISAVIHIALIGAIIAAGVYVKENPEIIDKPMSAFVVGAAPPPPLPPPPAPANGGARQVPRVERQEQTQPEPFQQPREVPQELPEVSGVVAVEEESGAMEGGVPGGVKGGTPGGIVGGDLRGEPGGTPGGRVGGIVGANGTGDTPLVVGGNVKAPVVILRVPPDYTEVARKARIRGIVIIEAVIDREGNVIDTRVLKPLPMGLDQSALHAIKQWKFRPGTLNGQPVPVYFNLTVNFELN